MQKRNKSTRRNVLKTGGGILTAGYLGAGTVAASSSEGTVSAEEAGVKKEVDKLLDNYEVLQALEIMDENNVDYTGTYNSLSTGEQQDAIEGLSSNETSSGASGGVSTQDFYAKDESNVTVFAFNLHSDFYRARIDFTVEAFDNAIDPDTWGTDDLISLAYSQPNEAVSHEFDYGMANYSDSILSVKERPVVDGPGAVIALNDALTDYSQSTYRGHLYYRIDKDSPDKETVAGKYVHTWSSGNLGNFSSVSYSWNGIGISVDPGTLNDKWELPGSGRF